MPCFAVGFLTRPFACIAMDQTGTKTKASTMGRE